MMTITQLEYILAVDQFRHFGKAAKYCSITQPTLSMQIQKLEDELGVIIFDRSKNPILPTEIGKKIITQAKVTIKEHHKIATIIDQDNELLTGEITLGIIPTLCPYLLPFFLEKFQQEYPQVRLSIREMQTPHIIAALDNDTIDAGILVTPLKNNQIIERKLFTEKFDLFLSKNHPLLKKPQIKVEDIKGMQPWLLEEGHCLRDQILNICKMQQKEEEIVFKAGSLETLVNLVSSGSGFTLLPEIATHYYQHYKNQIKEFTGLIPLREVSIVHSRLFLKERIIEALQNTIVNSLPKGLSSHRNQKTKIINIF